MKKLILIIIKFSRRFFYNTPIHRLKIVNIIYEKLFHAAFGKTEIMVVDYESCKFNVPSRDITILPSLLNDCYEKEEITFLRKLLQPGKTFVDVGANIGLFTIIAAKIVGSTGQVYAFEPEPENFSLLNKNAALNGVRNVQAENLALGNQAATLTLHIERNSIGTHSLLNKDGSVEKEVDVKVIKLDDYFNKISGKIDVMKIDVEGFEPYVLEGAKKTLSRVTFLLFEYNQNDINESYGIDNFVKLLKGFPYLYGINERKHTVSPFMVDDFHATRYINIIAAKTRVM